MLDLDVWCRVYRIVLSFIHDWICFMNFLVLTFGGNTHKKKRRIYRVARGYLTVEAKCYKVNAIRV